MNLLLVDDEYDVLQGIVNALDFAAIGIDMVYTAQTAAKAKTILLKEEIDVLVTDIEMPGESGISLLSWVRDQDMKIITLFCTAYADFSYAKKAVELHTFDYFLKPIQYPELQKIIGSAVQKACSDKREREEKLFGRKWLESQSELQKNFWYSLSSEPELAEAAVLEKGQKISLPYSAFSRFSLCLFFSRQAETLSAWQRYALQNITEELIDSLPGSVREALFFQKENALLTAILEKPEFEAASLVSYCQKIVEAAQKHLSVSLFCYYASNVLLTQAPKVFDSLFRAANNDIAGKKHICSLENFHPKRIPYEISQKLNEWDALLSMGKYSCFVEEVERHISDLAQKSELDLEYCKHFRMDMEHLIYEHLRKKGIAAEKTLSGEDFEAYRLRSLKSVESFQIYLRELVKIAEATELEKERPLSLAVRVREYIDTHFSEDLNSANLAKSFHFSADYLTRQFKKETGCSIHIYLHRIRIQKAKELLSSTDLPIYEIAIQTGYDSFSYFSFVFRNETGCTPSEFRKKSQYFGV